MHRLTLLQLDVYKRKFSNCDTVELFLNGVSVGEKGHDQTTWGPHGDLDPSKHPSENSGKEIPTDAMKDVYKRQVKTKRERFVINICSQL